MITATAVATVGMLRFLGLIVPSIVNLLIGDNLRRTLPWIAVTGADLALACDVVGRVVYYPYEAPIGTLMGIVVFLILLLRSANALLEQNR